VHIVDDVHRFVIYAGDFGQHFFVVVHYFFELQRVTGQYGDVLHHDCTGILATSAVDGKQQGFGQVATGTEELNLLAYFLV